jgi:hypothetical protein
MRRKAGAVMDRQDVQLLAILTGAIPLNDSRTNLSSFGVDELLGEMNEGNNEFDHAVAKHLIADRLEEMTFSEQTWLWRELNEYQTRTGDASLMKEQTAIGLTVAVMLDGISPSEDFSVFPDACLDVIANVPPLRAVAERLLEAQADRIVGFRDLRNVFVTYEDIELAPPGWLVDRAATLLNISESCEIADIKDFAEFPGAKPVALEAYRIRIAKLPIATLLDLDWEGDDFEEAWYAEIFKPDRRDQIVEWLGSN